MNDHVTRWLGAYVDGELRERRLRQVEDHLARCAMCRAELEELEAVSTLVRASPPLPSQNLLPAEQFVAQTGLRLPRQQQQPTWWRIVVTGWRLAPAGLVGAWAFVQALFLVTSISLIALQLGLGGDALAGLLPASPQGGWSLDRLALPGAGLDQILLGVVRLVASGGPLGWGFVLNIIATAVVGLMIWSWLAGWYVRRRRRQSVSSRNT